VCDRIWVLGVLVLIPVGSRNRISELLIEKCVIGLYLLYTSQNLLGTIFRVTFAVLYRRLWSTVGNYSILCYDKNPIENWSCNDDCKYLPWKMESVAKSCYCKPPRTILAPQSQALPSKLLYILLGLASSTDANLTS
jgi:hypothetical protein